MSAKDSPVYMILLPAVTTLRFTAHALAAHARAQLEQGDGQSALEDLLAILRIAAHQNEAGFLLTHLIAHSEGSRVLSIARQAMADHPDAFTVEHIRTLAHALESFRDAVGSVPWELERMGLRDAIQRSYSPGPGGISLINRDGVAFTKMLEQHSPARTLSEIDPLAGAIAGPFAAITSATRSESLRFATEFFDAAIRDSTMSPWNVEMPEALQVIERYQASAVSEWRYWFVLSWAAAPWRTMTNTWRFHAELDATLAVLAAEVFRREQSRWPASWDDLVPSYLPSTPLDMFDGKPVRMAERDGVWFIYSIGVDRTDDHGRIPVTVDGAFQPDAAAGWMSRDAFAALPDKERLARSGDWILWPPINPDTGAFLYTPRAEVAP
jgi:hypothetical protein